MTKQVRWRLKNVPDTFSLESKPQGRNAMADELIFYTNPMSRGQIVRWMPEEDRKRVVSGKSVSERVDLSGRRIIITKQPNTQTNQQKFNTRKTYQHTLP